MCNNVENKQNVVVAPMDTQPLTPNGTKGLWDKHVEMSETTDIPTEYADYSAYEEEWEVLILREEKKLKMGLWLH